MKLNELSVKRPVAVTMCVLIFVVIGIYALSMLPIDAMPEMDMKMVVVMTNYDNVASEEIENLIKNKALDSLNMARKSGTLVTGFEKVKEEIKKNKVEFIIEASDAGKDGKEKISFLAKTIEIFNLFSIRELDITLNKENTVHIAILKGDMSRVVYNNLKKYH